MNILKIQGESVLVILFIEKREKKVENHFGQDTWILIKKPLILIRR